MKNKKDEEIIIKLILIISVLIVVGIIWMICENVLLKPEFKITKEECWNEEELIILWNDVRAKNFNITHKQISEITYMWLADDYFIECPKNLDDCFAYKITEVCKPVEAEEIILNNYNCSVWEYDSSKYWNCMYRNEIFKDIVSKEDLTIEFLEENCFCKEACEISLCHTAPEGVYIFNYTDLGYECSNYECGEYQVEVKKWIIEKFIY